ncbi:hypothetical protein [Clostridium saccharobutylicum]|uniref:Uncharacterized protein n=1 Tax=Clostridium saccharobutylicum DSM 13864 TaxID=1345695 RepID=U5MT95_CLOSA|nr:hypothetical protein [Clostridium saccharobutylicum]AGX43984.1 hypothetical protein CLSA_c30170 [Clostridium saccharobutylicum DSM 13864]AQR91280.1 hypothetical protein CLOSC_30040 [Clostridium saccharobutylicum]AQS01184.1 hypothetical protein CSACC_30110 [Clostridium saccharobutylicum]AQS15167.1 hypothetical protein CLOSACC_30110 [Clostridium saccharobutylicum]MBA2905294.1 hypothetical protein [Clostridium saccharobutylicum]
MIKPQDFDNVQAFEGYEKFEPGGHVCKIIQVSETESSNGHRPMIVVLLDADTTDKQAGYWKRRFDSDQRQNKKYPNNATVRQLVYDADNNTNRGFKTFIEMVEKSNPGFQVQWGNNFAACFKNKLVGGVFGEEEYLDKNTGISKFAVKFQNFKTVEEIRKGVEVPKKKLLNPGSNSNNSFNYDTEITPVDDGDMPF